MTHFVRYAMVGVMIAGATCYALAQDDDLDLLLGDLIEEPAANPGGGQQAAEPEAEPKAEPAPAPVQQQPAAEPEKEAEQPAAQPAQEEPAAQPQEEPAAKPEKEAEKPAAEQPAQEEPAAEEPAQGEPAAEGFLAGMSDDTAALEAVTEEDRALNELEMLIRLKNQGLDVQAQACLTKARQLMTTPPEPGKAFDQYKAAIKMYSDAKKYFREHEANLPLKAECDNGIREARFRQAQSLFVDDNYAEALDLAQQVMREGHPNAAELVAAIQAEMNRPPEVRPTPVLPEFAKESYQEGRLAILERFRRATVYYHLAKYQEANDQLEIILRDDPNNEAAINLRDRIEKRNSARYNALKDSTHAEMIAQVEANWTPLGALGRNSEELYAPTVSTGTQTAVDDAGQKEAQAVLAKLQSIRLPEFSIRPPSTLADAVQIFAEMSKAYDKPELPPEEKGVAFVLNMSTGAAPAQDAAAEADPFATDTTASSGGLPPIQNINMPWVTLKDALDMVCEVTGSKYIIKGKTVVIVPNTYVDGKMETRTYNVMSGLLEKISGVQSDLQTSSSGGFGDSGDDWGSMGSSSLESPGAGTTPEMLKSFFQELGVSFEGNARIAYLSSIGKLRVTNTPENLALLEGLLEELNVTPYQIEVEARFVEVSQDDLNSLGFEWSLNSDIVGTIGSGIDWASSDITSGANANGAGGIGAGGTHVFRPGSSSFGGTGDANVAVHGGSFNNGMRFLGDGATYANRINLSESTLAPNDEFLGFSAVFGKMDISLILHMLSQRTDTDMLSSPKVLARPGQEAMIRVVTEWIYPTEFDVTELDNNDDNNDNSWNISGVGGGVNVQAPPVKFAVEPQSFEKQDVGVSLQVIPEVSQEGQMINLLVNPKVVEYLGDFEYGMQVPYIQYGMTGGVVTSAEVEYYQVSMPQPMFHFREISTYLSVYNGSTVVMGGLITETRNSFEDKIPILGDLPFIGFLFRSTGEYSEKRNLLVFLTARLVDPAGRPLKTATDGRMGASAMSAGSSPSDTLSSTIAE